VPIVFITVVIKYKTVIKMVKESKLILNNTRNYRNEGEHKHPLPNPPKKKEN
jgi:hypothetical protein